MPLGEGVTDLYNGERDVTDYVGELYEQIDSLESDVRAWVGGPKRPEWAMAEAAAIAERYPEPKNRPLLYGVPVGIKDIFHVDGLPTQAGADLPPGELANRQATVVASLRGAGALILGKTVTTEFAYFEPGPTRNPHNPAHTPGGSSSGSAAAVAAGMCPLALGTQTIGSVVRPAAFCGVVGVKPTYGRVPIEGVLPLAPSLDHVGFFTQDIRGATLAAAVLCDDWTALPDSVERPTLGVPADAYLNQTDQTGRTHFEHHLEGLTTAGYDVIRTEVFEDIDEINDRHNRLMAAEAALSHRENGWYPDYRDRYAKSTLELIEEGESVPTAEVATGRTARIALRTEVEATMADEGIDVWVSPAATGPAPEGIESTGDPAMNLPWTNTGMPALTLPIDRTDAGLPLGLQCAAATDADEDLLNWATLLAEDLGVISK